MTSERGAVFLPRGKPNTRYTGEFKQMTIEDMRNNGLGYNETMRKYEIRSKDVISEWEHIYLEEGAEGLYIERRGRGGGLRKGLSPGSEKKVEEDLIAENQQLRMENDYLKKLNALAWQKQLQKKKRK